VNWGGSNALFMAAFRPFDRPQVAQFSSDINATTLRPTFEVKQIYWAEHDRLFGCYSLESCEMSEQDLYIRYGRVEPI
jgi:hypothetical protein